MKLNYLFPHISKFLLSFQIRFKIFHKNIKDPELRKKFEGKPEHVVNFFFMVAEELRELMAKLGVKTFQDLIGQTKFLRYIFTLSQ